MTEANNIIASLKNVSRIYTQGKIEVVANKDVNLDIYRGDFAAFWGPSGSGKTTALNLLGLLDSPTSGQVIFEGTDVSNYSAGKLAEIRRDRIGFIFQAYNLMPVLTAYENAELVLSLRGTPQAERRDKVMAILEEVGLKGLENRRPVELSGGQQQRVAIARAIVANPSLVLADEPTANVDSETAASILELMERMNKVHGVTFLFSTHDQNVLDRAQRLVKLKDGRVVEDIRREEKA